LTATGVPRFGGAMTAAKTTSGTLVGGLAAALLALAALTPAPAWAGPGSPRTGIVSLGDSFISGEGGRWLGNGSEPLGTRSGTDRAAFDCDPLGFCDYDPERIYGASEENECHRADVAPIRSAPIAVDEQLNLACSGARARNLWPAALGGRPHFGEPPQADRLAAAARRLDLRLVLVTVGANDVGFGELVAGCALDWARSDPAAPELCHGYAQAEIDALLPRARRRVARVLDGVRQTMRAAGYRRRDYRLVLGGYASPFPPSRWLRYPETGWERLTEGGCPLWNADADWAAGPGIDSIVAALRQVAAEGGAEFLDLRHALDGHQLCDSRSHRVGAAGPTEAGAEWVRRLSFTQGTTRESLHPNAYGQRALGRCLALLYARRRGEWSCRAEPRRPIAGAISIEPLGD
jgi:lysophospholipase L1-like esterase